MSSKKEKLASLICIFGFEKLIKSFRRIVRNDIRIIAYHRICAIDSLNDQELVSATPEEFERQVEYIANHYNAITFADLISCIAEQKKLPKNTIIITFDDGFKDNYTNAFPILKKYSVPATMFVSTGYLGSDTTFWFNGLSRMIKQSIGKSFELKDSVYNISDDPQSNEVVLAGLLQLLKKTPNKERLDIIDSIKKQLEYEDDCDPLALPMNWDDVIEMSKSGIEFGSHTVSHPILSQLSAAELHSEIVDSKLALEDNLGFDIQVIAYPVGGREAYNQAVIDKSIEAGYQLGASYITGVNKLNSIDRFQLKRMHIERYVGFNLFKSMLALPEVFAK